MDTAEARTRELEVELEAVRTELNEQKTLFSEQEERNKQMYLKMYTKGQEAARIEQADQVFKFIYLKYLILEISYIYLNSVYFSMCTLIGNIQEVQKRSLLYLMLFVKLQIFVQAHQSPSKVTVAELLQQLTVTQAELENVKVRYYIHTLHIFNLVWKLRVDEYIREI